MPPTGRKPHSRIVRIVDECKRWLNTTLFRFNFPAFIFIYVIIASFNLYISGNHEFRFINIYATIIWSLYFPIALTGLIGAWNIRRMRLSDFAGKVDNKVIFLVPTIGRMSVAPALKRVVDSILEHAPANLSNYRVDVVTEEGAEAIDLLAQYYQDNAYVNLVVVPKSYSPPNGTRYKSRANQYALELRRAAGERDDRTFIYHLDDDTAVRCDTISSIAEFIANDTGQYHAAQGILAFPYDLSPSLFCRLADSVRPADDFSRFHFYTGLLKRPMGGFHGEHLLVRASIEDRIGWDFGPTVTVEDAYFALTFSEQYPGCTCFLNSYSYGASPDSIRDLIKQRQRWASGIFRLSFDRQFRVLTRLPMLYSMTNWSLGIVQHVLAVLIFAYLIGTPNTSPVAIGFSFLWAFNFSFIVWMYFEGLKINLSVSGERYNGRFARYFVCTLFLVIVFSAVEGWAALKGFVNFITRKQGFIVINKQS